MVLLMSSNEWLNTKTLLEEFGIAVSTQAKYRQLKMIPYSKIGGFVFYSRTKINAWIEKHTFEADGVT